MLSEIMDISEAFECSQEPMETDDNNVTIALELSEPMEIDLDLSEPMEIDETILDKPILNKPILAKPILNKPIGQSIKISIFTDGSKNYYRAGWGFVIYVNGITDVMKLQRGNMHSDTSSYGAEVEAILQAMMFVTRFSKNVNIYKVTIYSDCKRAIDSLVDGKYPEIQKLVECMENVEIGHVYAHSLIEGNEIADKLAKGDDDAVEKYCKAKKEFGSVSNYFEKYVPCR